MPELNTFSIGDYVTIAFANGLPDYIAAQSTDLGALEIISIDPADLRPPVDESETEDPAADCVYDFASDTVGQTPSGVTVGTGDFLVQADGTIRPVLDAANVALITLTKLPLRPEVDFEFDFRSTGGRLQIGIGQETSALDGFGRPNDRLEFQLIANDNRFRSYAGTFYQAPPLAVNFSDGATRRFRIRVTRDGTDVRTLIEWDDNGTPTLVFDESVPEVDYPEDWIFTITGGGGVNNTNVWVSNIRGCVVEESDDIYLVSLTDKCLSSNPTLDPGTDTSNENVSNFRYTAAVAGTANSFFIRVNNTGTTPATRNIATSGLRVETIVATFPPGDNVVELPLASPLEFDAGDVLNFAPSQQNPFPLDWQISDGPSQMSLTIGASDAVKGHADYEMFGTSIIKRYEYSNGDIKHFSDGVELTGVDDAALLPCPEPETVGDVFLSKECRLVPGTPITGNFADQLVNPPTTGSAANNVIAPVVNEFSTFAKWTATGNGTITRINPLIESLTVNGGGLTLRATNVTTGQTVDTNLINFGTPGLTPHSPNLNLASTFAFSLGDEIEIAASRNNNNGWVFHHSEANNGIEWAGSAASEADYPNMRFVGTLTPLVETDIVTMQEDGQPVTYNVSVSPAVPITVDPAWELCPVEASPDAGFLGIINTEAEFQALQPVEGSTMRVGTEFVVGGVITFPAARYYFRNGGWLIEELTTETDYNQLLAASQNAKPTHILVGKEGPSGAGNAMTISLNGTPATFENLVLAQDNGGGQIEFFGTGNSVFNRHATTVEKAICVGDKFTVVQNQTPQFHTEVLALSETRVQGANLHEQGFLRMTFAPGGYTLFSEDGASAATGGDESGTFEFEKTPFGWLVTRNGTEIYTTPEYKAETNEFEPLDPALIPLVGGVEGEAHPDWFGSETLDAATNKIDFGHDLTELYSIRIHVVRADTNWPRVQEIVIDRILPDSASGYISTNFDNDFVGVRDTSLAELQSGVIGLIASGQTFILDRVEFRKRYTATDSGQTTVTPSVDTFFSTDNANDSTAGTKITITDGTLVDVGQAGQVSANTNGDFTLAQRDEPYKLVWFGGFDFDGDPDLEARVEFVTNDLTKRLYSLNATADSFDTTVEGADDSNGSNTTFAAFQWMRPTAVGVFDASDGPLTVSLTFSEGGIGLGPTGGTVRVQSAGSPVATAATAAFSQNESLAGYTVEENGVQVPVYKAVFVGGALPLGANTLGTLGPMSRVFRRDGLMHWNNDVREFNRTTTGTSRQTLDVNTATGAVVATFGTDWGTLIDGPTGGYTATIEYTKP